MTAWPARVPIPGLDGYEATRVFSLHRGEPFELKQDRTNNGYMRVTLSKDRVTSRVSVHRLVATTFLGPPPSPKHVAAHNDGTRDNNKANNIRWATSSENALDRHRVHGRGHAHWTTRDPLLTEHEVYLIREFWATGCYRRKDLAARFGVKPQLISDVAIRKQYVG